MATTRTTATVYGATVKGSAAFIANYRRTVQRDIMENILSSGRFGADPFDMAGDFDVPVDHVIEVCTDLAAQGYLTHDADPEAPYVRYFAAVRRMPAAFVADLVIDYWDTVKCMWGSAACSRFLGVWCANYGVTLCERQRFAVLSRLAARTGGRFSV